MKLTIAVLLLAAACHAEVAGSTQKEDSRTERKAPEQSSVQKRAPAALPTASPSPTPGIEYADSKDSQTEKTPAQQIYLAPASPVAKFSDVLAGQGAAFPAAIAGHLYSPVSIYQPRLSSPTTYEISAPIPSQLAYSEHKIAYQPQQNAIQNAAQEYNQKLPNPKQAIARLTVNYQPYPQQLLVQPQPSLYNQQPQLLQQFPVYQPEALNQPIQPVQYQGPQIFGQNQQFPQQPLIQLVQAPSGITYARQEESNEEQAHQKPIQRELKTGQPEGVKELEKRIELQQNNAPLQGAVSYASFSQGPPAPAFTQPQYQQQPLQRYQPQPQYQSQQYLQPIQYQQPLYQQQQIQYQVPQYQIPQYQPAPQRQIISRPEANVVAASKQVQRPVTYFRQGPTIQQIQPQYQHQYQGQENNYQANLPPVQYFGKFAQSIFGQYQQQQQQQV